MDYRKAACLYHPNQAITNFCRDSSRNSIQKTVSCLCARVVLVTILNITSKIKPNPLTLI